MAGIDNARQEAIWLLESLLGAESGALLFRLREALDPEQLVRWKALVSQRAARVPLQQLVGSWPFLELELTVDARALVPRPETEDLVLLARRLLESDAQVTVADVGTGSGCMALALASSHPRLRLLALELDPLALALARENVARTGLAGRVALLRADLLAPVAPASLGMIVANLPYVSSEQWEGLAPEVRQHDPRQALIAGEGGLALIRRLVVSAPRVLARGAWIALEMAPSQVAALVAELPSGAWSRVETHADRHGRERFVLAQAR